MSGGFCRQIRQQFIPGRSLANMRDLIVKGQYLVCLDTDQVADQLLMMFACSWTGNQKPLDI